MFTFLTNKYGLKSLVIEYSAAIINSIKKYSKENVDVSLFGKILRNDLEEDYRIIYYKLKSTLFELLVYFLKSKNPYKSNTEIIEIAKAKTKSILTQEEWNAIIYFLYDDKDAVFIEEMIFMSAEKEEKLRKSINKRGYNAVNSKKGRNFWLNFYIIKKIIFLKKIIINYRIK